MESKVKDYETTAYEMYRRECLAALGENERMALKFGVGLNGEDYQEYVQHTFIGDEEE